MIVSGVIAMALATAMKKSPEPQQQSEPLSFNAAGPLVGADKTITFQLKAPNAKLVFVDVEGRAPLAMTKSKDGTWRGTTPALEPDLYGYAFSVDGETVIDPNNPLRKPNLIWQSNMIEVPGDMPLVWDCQNVPHGEVHEISFHSNVVGDDRNFFVYTPPDYSENLRRTYPALYLFHGYSDTANGWTAVGKANFILDNLIAQKEAKPMIVVMPLGYGVHDFAFPGRRAFGDHQQVIENFTKFEQSLLTEVMPQVESKFRASKTAKGRAIAGLSMGGAETLFVGLHHPEMFSALAAFSSGGLDANLDQEFPTIDAKAFGKLKPWIMCGTEDGLYPTNLKIVEWLKGKNISVRTHYSSGGHVWMNWRRYLAAFAPELFPGFPS